MTGGDLATANGGSNGNAGGLLGGGAGDDGGEGGNGGGEEGGDDGGVKGPSKIENPGIDCIDCTTIDNDSTLERLSRSTGTEIGNAASGVI